MKPTRGFYWFDLAWPRERSRELYGVDLATHWPPRAQARHMRARHERYWRLMGQRWRWQMKARQRRLEATFYACLREWRSR